MKSLFDFLERQKLTATIILGVYYFLVVTMHLKFGKFVARTLDVPLGRDTYNLIILGLSSLLCLGFLYWFFRGLKHTSAKERKVTLAYLVLTLAFIILSINVIMVINIELIHILQYAIFAILLFPLIGRYFEVLFWTTFFGALDELYQYMYLAPKSTDYFDINDVIINMLGAAMGLIFVRSQGVFQSKKDEQILHSSWFWGTALIFGSIFTLWIVGELTFYPNGESVIFEFIRDFQPGFWRKIHPNVLFHVIQPLEGLIILVLLFFIYKNLKLEKNLNTR